MRIPRNKRNLGFHIPIASSASPFRITITASITAMTIPAALHPFLILAKSATGAACADIIKQATSAPGVYTFTALLECENIKRVAYATTVLNVACGNGI